MPVSRPLAGGSKYTEKAPPVPGRLDACEDKTAFSGGALPAARVSVFAHVVMRGYEPG
jgi:hypothetical protein